MVMSSLSPASRAKLSKAANPGLAPGAIIFRASGAR